MYYCISVLMVASLIHFFILLNICDISMHFFIISPFSFRAENNPDHQMRLLAIVKCCKSCKKLLRVVENLVNVC
jgi:hypothetical protein